MGLGTGGLKPPNKNIAPPPNRGVARGVARVAKATPNGLCLFFK